MKLSVNLNKVALLRNSRGGHNPGPEHAATTCIDAGAAGITLHLREDRRHARDADVRNITRLCRARGVEFNLEGDPRLELIEIALEVQPSQLTLVPVTPGEVTSDHGWILPRDAAALRPSIERAQAAGVRVALFMDPIEDDMRAAADTGADRVELYTEPYASAFGGARQAAELERVRAAARCATRLGLGVNAGHDLSLANLPLLAREVPEVLEVSIGHALIAEALHLGLPETIRRYVEATDGVAVVVPRTF